MSAVFMFLAMSQRTGGKLKQTSFFLLDTERLLFDFAKAIDHRRAQTDEVVFEWTEPAEVGQRSHPERSLSPRDCLEPAAVLPGLRHLKRLAGRKDPEIREIWHTLRQRLEAHPALSPSRLEDLVARDLDGLILFCEEAETRGDVVVSIRVP
ncbi:MAG: hypothetical protein ABI665_11700 [Vicinamibacterales bacterium]